jgi:hypothetical protein
VTELIDAPPPRGRKHDDEKDGGQKRFNSWRGTLEGGSEAVAA